MINLLSPNDKKQLHAARRNTVWIRYTFLIIAVLISINIILGATALIIQGEQDASRQKIVTNEDQRDKEYISTRQEAERFRQNLSIAKTILSEETKYSDIILNIARAIPSGCILGNLTLNAQSFSLTTSQTLSFNCRTQDDVVKLKTSMENAQAVFGKVSILSTTLSQGGANTSPYPVTASISTILKKPPSSQGDQE